MLFNLRKKKQHDVEEHEPSQRSWQGVKRRAMRKLMVRTGQPSSREIPKSNSDPHVAYSNREMNLWQERARQDEPFRRKSFRRASCPSLYPPANAEFPVSENDISKLFRRNAIDSVSSNGRHLDGSLEDSGDLVLNIRHVDNHPAHMPEVVSPITSPVSSGSTASEGVVPDILVTPTWGRTLSTPRAPPPTPVVT